MILDIRYVCVSAGCVGHCSPWPASPNDDVNFVNNPLAHSADIFARSWHSITNILNIHSKK